MKRSIIIGDVHGCCTELYALLEKVQPTSNDVVIFVGDLVDKGPDSAGVVRLARRIPENYGAEVILVDGNHEEKHRRFRKYENGCPGAGDELRGADEMRSITKRLDEDDIAFLESGVICHEIKHHDALVVHAGVPPVLKHVPTDFEGYWSKRKKARKVTDQMLRVRFVNPKGWMVALGREKEDDVYWSEAYDGRFGKVFYGHQPYVLTKRVVVKNNTYGLDLGCVYGNVLAAAILTLGSDMVAFEYASAAGKYAELNKVATKRPEYS
jgi:serine/threonine protein phosphatase 1